MSADTVADDARRAIADVLPLIIAACHWADVTRERPSPTADAALHAAVDAWRAKAFANGGAQ